MAFIPVPDVAKVNFSMKAGSTLTASIGLYFAMPEFSSADLDTLVASLASEFATDLMVPLSDDYNLFNITAYDLRTQNGFKSTLDTDIDGGTVLTTTPVSPVLSCVVSFYSNRRGKWNQGRVYVPGLSEDFVNEMDIQQGTVDAIRGVFEALRGDPPDGWSWVVVSRYLNKQARENGVYAPVQDIRVRSNRFGVQRRRAQRP